MEKNGRQTRKKIGAYAFARRIIMLYDRFNDGKKLQKKDIKEEFGIEDKTVERDLGFLREYYVERYKLTDTKESIRYNAKEGDYYLNKSLQGFFTMEEALALSEILLASRAFVEEEKELLVSKILAMTSDADHNRVEKMILNERGNYLPLKHGKKLLGRIGELEEYIRKQEVIEIIYKKMDGKVKIHQIKPVAIMFEIYYFYLHAYMADNKKENTTIFRIDRIIEIKGTGEKFQRETGKDRFQEGEVRRRVQFMYSGKSERVEFEYHGKSIEAVQDWLPEAEVTPMEGGGYLVRALIQGEGARMWIRSQGDWVKMLGKERK